MPCRLPVGIILSIAALGGDHLRMLLARVVRCQPSGDRWFYGCELANYLSEQEIQAWLS
jgi:hypothetical protein